MIHYYKFFCSRENLKGIRDFVTSVLRNYSLSDVEINQMVLAVDEVCTNLIIHSHKCNADDSIELSIKNQKDGITFEIIDRAAAYFDFASYKHPDLKQMVKEGRNGGVGLLLVKRLMDKVEVEYKDTQSTWRLYKELPFQAPERV
ncbi:ATP-binding protein [Rhodocytophaga aerolata]|jgi:serine/threonine-protein kinase RsbW|uniref:ATP-binding protein n=1 Tax=Rhodocytophaga aerolata TaxID=455078 RepID=A0ABT8R8Z8_9BACT|nr:ATP-binding protein [Rhodocytophaga aerolata]MDO1448562.1 ATP-binding protein [Rhodocytophaga aerolata]